MLGPGKANKQLRPLEKGKGDGLVRTGVTISPIKSLISCLKVCVHNDSRQLDLSHPNEAREFSDLSPFLTPWTVSVACWDLTHA